MKGGHRIYCISNASTDCYVNTLTRFTNLLPNNLELDERRDWEVGVVAFGLHLNVKEDFVFDVVQVKSNIVSTSSIANSNILCVADLPSSKKRKYFYHSLRNIRYYPIQNTSVKSVGIEFLDAYGKRLELKSGQPSLVLLHLRKRKRAMSYLTKHVRIDSKMDEVINPSQKNNNFEVHLSNPIYLNEGAKIALADISFPNRISNMPLSVFDKKIEVITDPFAQEIKVELGQRKTFSDLLHRLNEGRDSVVRYIVEFGQTKKTKESADMFFHAIYIGPTMCDTEFKSHEVKVRIPPEFKNILGIKEEYIAVGPERTEFISQQPMRNPDPSETIPPVKVKVEIEPIRFSFSIEKRLIKTSDELIEAMRNSMSEDLQLLIRISAHENHFKVEHCMNRFNRNITARIKVPHEIRLLLGISQDEDIVLSDGNGREQFISPDRLDPHCLYPGVMICYANFVNHSVIGDGFYPVLKVIPLNRREEEDNYVTTHFENLEYLKCNTSRLDLLRFQLKRLDGELIRFETNEKIMMNLAIQNPK